MRHIRRFKLQIFVMGLIGFPIIPPGHLIVYATQTEGYHVQIVDTSRAQATSDIAAVSVSLCPVTSGPTCFLDQISATKKSAGGPWGPILCGEIRCPEQESMRALVERLVKRVRKPQYMVVPDVPGQEV